MSKGHSKLGIVSFTCGLFVPLIAFLSIVGFFVFGGSSLAPFIPPMLLAIAGLSVVSLVLGLLSLFQKDVRKVFGAVGFVFGIVEVSTIALVWISTNWLIEKIGEALGSGFGKM